MPAACVLTSGVLRSSEQRRPARVNGKDPGSCTFFTTPHTIFPGRLPAVHGCRGVTTRYARRSPTHGSTTSTIPISSRAGQSTTVRQPAESMSSVTCRLYVRPASALNRKVMPASVAIAVNPSTFARSFGSVPERYSPRLSTPSPSLSNPGSVPVPPNCAVSHASDSRSPSVSAT